MVKEFIGSALILLGSVFYFISALGLIRMPDVYNRMQTATKTSTLASLGVMIGVGIINFEYLPKTIIIGAFILFSNPISAHSLIRASQEIGIPLWEESTVNKYETVSEDEENNEEDGENG